MRRIPRHGFRTIPSQGGFHALDWIPTCIVARCSAVLADSLGMGMGILPSSYGVIIISSNWMDTIVRMHSVNRTTHWRWIFDLGAAVLSSGFFFFGMGRGCLVDLIGIQYNCCCCECMSRSPWYSDSVGRILGLGNGSSWHLFALWWGKVDSCCYRFCFVGTHGHEYVLSIGKLLGLLLRALVCWDEDDRSSSSPTR